MFPSRTTQRLCQAPKPETSSNMVMKPLLETCRENSQTLEIQTVYSPRHYLTLAVAVQLEVDVSIERRNVGNSLQPPVLLAQTVDGDDRVSNLEIYFPVEQNRPSYKVKFTMAKLDVLTV